MPTNEKRREVAAKLRKYGGKKYPNFNLAYLFAAMGVNLLDAMEHKIADAELYEKLADLIEPEPERTCRFKPSTNCEHYGKPECSECGWYDASPGNDSDYFGYCPCCGARILDEEVSE